MSLHPNVFPLQSSKSWMIFSLQKSSDRFSWVNASTALYRFRYAQFACFGLLADCLLIQNSCQRLCTCLCLLRSFDQITLETHAYFREYSDILTSCLTWHISSRANKLLSQAFDQLRQVVAAARSRIETPKAMSVLGSCLGRVHAELDALGLYAESSAHVSTTTHRPLQLFQ